MFYVFGLWDTDFQDAHRFFLQPRTLAPPATSSRCGYGASSQCLSWSAGVTQIYTEYWRGKRKGRLCALPESAEGRPGRSPHPGYGNTLPMRATKVGLAKVVALLDIGGWTMVYFYLRPIARWPQSFKNSIRFFISSADIAAFSLRMRRICSPAE